jgi:proteasome lid subunit RPN8/RPN11
MNIRKETLESILSQVPTAPPETGGILGGQNNIISHFVLDRGTQRSNGYDIYAPNTQLFHETIRYWAQESIEFYGIFHSHFSGGITLSSPDLRYITSIMLAMPPHIQSLYFPIVLPQKYFIVYRADRIGGEVSIVRDETNII